MKTHECMNQYVEQRKYDTDKWRLKRRKTKRMCKSKTKDKVSTKKEGKKTGMLGYSEWNRRRWRIQTLHEAPHHEIIQQHAMDNSNNNNKSNNKERNNIEDPAKEQNTGWTDAVALHSQMKVRKGSNGILRPRDKSSYTIRDQTEQPWKKIYTYFADQTAVLNVPSVNETMVIPK